MVSWTARLRGGRGLRTGAAAAFAAAAAVTAVCVATAAPARAGRWSLHRASERVQQGSAGVGARPQVVATGVSGAHGEAAPFPAPGVARAAVKTAGAMVRVPAGDYLPLYGMEGMRVPVEGFQLDRYPVTRGEYARFLEAYPEWRRDGSAGRAAGSAYLVSWGASPVDGLDARRPVTEVPRAAAEAYCAAQGKRLPTVDEWEYAAAASPQHRDASEDAEFQQRVLELYTRPRRSAPGPVGSTFRNAFGVYDLHGLVWEWTAPAAAPEQEHAHEAMESSGSDHEHHDMASKDGDRAHHARAHAAGRHDLGCAGSAVGATDTRAYAAFLRYAFREGLKPTTALPVLGFRCAR